MDPAIHDHVAPTGADSPDGTYRVVGRTDGTVTLLRVTDSVGSRTNTGEVYHVSRADLDGFEGAEDPDAGVSPVRWVGTLLDGLVHRMVLPW